MRSTSQRFGATSEPRPEDFRHVLSSGSLQTHLFYPGEQSVGLHPQKFRGSINAFDFPASLLQGSKNILALAASHFRFGQVFRFGPGQHSTGREALPRDTALSQIKIHCGTNPRNIELQSAALSKNDRALDDVAQLPDVAGPVVTLESFYARSG